MQFWLLIDKVEIELYSYQSDLSWYLLVTTHPTQLYFETDFLLEGFQGWIWPNVYWTSGACQLQGTLENFYLDSEDNLRLGSASGFYWQCIMYVYMYIILYVYKVNIWIYITFLPIAYPCNETLYNHLAKVSINLQKILMDQSIKGGRGVTKIRLKKSIK